MPTSPSNPTPQSLAAFALVFGTGAPTRDQQQQIATHYGGFLPTYDSQYFLVDWQDFEAGEKGNAGYFTTLQPHYGPSVDAMSVALGYMTQAQFTPPLPANIGIMRTPADGHPVAPPAGSVNTKVINGKTYIFAKGSWTMAPAK